MLSTSLTYHFGMILFIIICWMAISGAADKPDCKKQVFHPKCRGISAKRSSKPSMTIDEMERPYSSEDNLDSADWRDEYDAYVADQIMRDILLANMKYSMKRKSAYEDDK